MNYTQAKRGKQFVLTASGKTSLPERTTADTLPGEPIKGREQSVPVSWVQKGYVTEVWEC